MSVVNKYIDSNDFLTATSVYNEEGLVTLAPDGYYQNNGTYRRQLNGLLGPSSLCEICVEPCGVGISPPQGDKGYYNLDFDAGGTVNDTGAIVIYFNPFGFPDGIRVLYDNVYYNTVTNNTDGRIQSTSGVADAFTILGSPTNTCVPSTPNTTSYIFYNGFTGSNWNTGTPTPQSITINVGDDVRGGANQFSTLVVPKPNASPNVVSLQVLGVCDDTAWNVEVSCPVALPSVLASGPGATDACQATQNIPVYFAQNYNDTNTAPIVGNFVFTDENGVTPLNNTSTVYYYITGTIAFSVLNGVVVSSGQCTGTPTYNYYIAKGCPGGTYDGFDRKVKSTASLNYNGTPTGGDSFSEFGSCWYIDGASTETAYDANLNCGCGFGNTCPSADCSSLDVSNLSITSGCAACTGPISTTSFFATAGTTTLNDGTCGGTTDTLLYHDGTGTLPQLGDTIYAGPNTGSQTVSWTGYRGTGPADVADGVVTTATVNASGVVQSTYGCP